MLFYSSIRHFRKLTTTAAAATNSTTTTAARSPAAISISKAKIKLRSEYDPDKALKIISSVTNPNGSVISFRYAQDLTVRRLAKSRRFADIESLIESRKSDPKITQERYLCTLIRSYGLAGMFDHALQMFNQLEELGTPRSTLSFNALLSACNQSKLFDKVPQLFDEIPKKHGVLPDKITYGVLVKSYCSLGLPEKGIEILKDMEGNNVEITMITFTTVMDALYKKGMNEMGDKMWDQMMSKGCLPDSAAYNVRIMYAHNGNKPGTVKALIDEMVKAGVKPDIISYNYLMTCYCKNGMMDEAKKAYEGLQGNGCKPNAATFRFLINYLCINESFEKGYEVFQKSVEIDKIPGFGTLKYLVEGLVKTKKSKEAKALIQTVKNKFPASLMNGWKKVEEELGLDSNG